MDQRIHQTAGDSLEQVAAIDATHAVVVAEDGNAWFTVDETTFLTAGGVLPSNNDLTDVSFSSMSLGYAAREGKHRLQEH